MEWKPVLRDRGRGLPWTRTLGQHPSAASLLSARLPLTIPTGTITGALGQGAPSSGLVTWGLCCQGGYKDPVKQNIHHTEPRDQ